MSSERSEKFKSFILVGAPGAGKGTQGSILGAIPRFFHFSSGEAFRRLDTRSEIGQKFIKYSSQGELVPDELTIEFFADQINARAGSHRFKPDIDILILDGIPRNPIQAKLLGEYVEVLHLFHLSCPKREELVDRIRKRALKQGRLDDANEEVIHTRIRTYEEETKDLLEFYADVRSDINANQPPVMVLSDILDVIINHSEWQLFTGELD